MDQNSVSQIYCVLELLELLLIMLLQENTNSYFSQEKSSVFYIDLIQLNQDTIFSMIVDDLTNTGISGEI